MPTWGWLLICAGCLVAGATIGLVVTALAVASSRREEAEHP